MTQELSYLQLKTANEARLSEEQRSEQRKRNILLLVNHFLAEEGYMDTARCLEQEAGANFKKFAICDNVDLQTILQEYESYYYVKFGKWPKISKKSRDNNDSNDNTSTKNRAIRSSKVSNAFSLPSINHASDSESQPKRVSSNTQKKSKLKQEQPFASPVNQLSDLELSGISLSPSCQAAVRPADEQRAKKQIVDCRSLLAGAVAGDHVMMDADFNDRLLKPVSGFAGVTGEFRELAAVISRDIYSENPNVRWGDIIGLDEAKRLVKEAVVYPIKYPQLFTGILSPWKGLLLYGPSGTGKTLLAKAVATECSTTFFNISASTIVSKWRGESEKLVRVLFELARFHAPSTIFLDELDALMSQRGGDAPGSGEHEGSRRMKTELLVQMDGLAKSNDLVFLLAASNLPWELDHAMLRRLEKRILVDLPSQDARKKMFEHYLPPQFENAPGGLQLAAELDYEALAKLTENYSGSDIRLVCKEAAMRPVRKIFDLLEQHRPGPSSSTLPPLAVDPVKTSDVEAAISRTKPSARGLQAKYERWKQDFESV